MQQQNFKKSNIEATLGVFFDSFIKLMIAISVFLGVFKFSTNAVYKEIIPSFGVSIFITQIFLFCLCLYINKTKSDTHQAIPIPAGISSDRFFIWIFAIMLPTYKLTGDLNLVLAVGVGANFLSSFFSMILALFSQFILKIIPSPALFATLSGASLAWLILSPLKEAFNNPIIAFVCFFIVIGSYIGNFKTKISPLLISIILGSIISFYLKPFDNISIENLSFYTSISFFDNLLLGIKEALKFLPMILGITIIELITNIQAVEQAKKLNTNYNSNLTIFFVNFISLASSFIGNPFTLSLLWGYSTWHKINTSKYYGLYVGFLFLAISLTGFSSIIMNIIPIASVLPIIVFIGIISISDSFKMHDNKYYLPMIIAMVFPLMDFLKANIGGDIPNSLLFLAQGATLISLLWGSIFVFLVDRKYLSVGLSFMLGSFLAFFGLIHSHEVKLFANTTFSLIYLGFGVLFIGYNLISKYRFNTKENI